MRHIFYFAAVLPLLWELKGVVSPKNVKQFTGRMKEKKDFKLFDSSEKGVAVLMLGYFIWVFVGLFSSQWPLFVAIFILSLIPKPWVWVQWLDSLLTFFILVFIVVNVYHLHLDILKLV